MLEVLFKAGLVAVFVAAAVTLARRGSQRWAGLTAAAVSIPNLAMLAWQHDSAFVVSAAVGCLLSTLACLAFAHTYRSLAMHRCTDGNWGARALITSLAATLVAVLTGALVLALQLHLALSASAAAGAALSACVLSMRWRNRAVQATASQVVAPLRGGRMAAARSSVRTTWCAPLCAGVVCAVLCVTSTRLGPLVSGLLLGLPLVALCLAMGRHIEAGPAAAVASLHGYPEGLLLRALFALVLALTLPWTSTATAFTIAFALVILLPTVLSRWRSAGEARRSPALRVSTDSNFAHHTEAWKHRTDRPADATASGAIDIECSNFQLRCVRCQRLSLPMCKPLTKGRLPA